MSHASQALTEQTPATANAIPRPRPSPRIGTSLCPHTHVSLTSVLCTAPWTQLSICNVLSPTRPEALCRPCDLTTQPEPAQPGLSRCGERSLTDREADEKGCAWGPPGRQETACG